MFDLTEEGSAHELLPQLLLHTLPRPLPGHIYARTTLNRNMYIMFLFLNNIIKSMFEFFLHFFQKNSFFFFRIPLLL